MAKKKQAKKPAKQKTKSSVAERRHPAWLAGADKNSIRQKVEGRR
jgi:hypothetical protein